MPTKSLRVKRYSIRSVVIWNWFWELFVGMAMVVATICMIVSALAESKNISEGIDKLFRFPQVLAFVIPIAGIAMVCHAMYEIVYPARNPVFRALMRRGQLKEAASEFDREMLHSEKLSSGFYISENWLLHRRLMFTRICYLGDIVWICRWNGVREESPSSVKPEISKLIICDCHGERHETQLDGIDITGLLKILHMRVPGAIRVWRAEFEILWKEDPKGFLESAAQLNGKEKY